MKMLKLPSAPCPQDTAQRGFVVIAVLIVTALAMSFVAAGARHAITTDKNSPVAKASVERNESAHAAMHYARQQLAVGSDDLNLSLQAGTHMADLQLTELAGGNHMIQVSALDGDGLGATVLAEAAQQAVPTASHPDSLPTVDYERLQEIMSDTTIEKFWYGGQVALSDTEIVGLVIVENSSALYLDNVIVHGAIISEDVIYGDPFGEYDAATVPCAVLNGTAKIIPGDFLPGISVIMPDGVLTNTSNTSAVEIHGDVSVFTIDIEGTGAIHGQVAAVNTQLGDVELVASVHDVEPWAEDLDLQGAFVSRSLAFVPRVSSIDDVQAIKEYSFGER